MSVGANCSQQACQQAANLVDQLMTHGTKLKSGKQQLGGHHCGCK